MPERRLKEARYFLEQMKKPEIQADRLVFTYNLNAFLGASRSVMQYLYKRAGRVGKPEWYAQLAEKSVWCRRFRNIRNMIVHEGPFQPDATHQITLQGDETDQVGVMKKCLQVIGGEVVDELQSYSVEYHMTVEEEQLPVLDCCEAYVGELAENIEKAEDKGIIPDFGDIEL